MRTLLAMVLLGMAGTASAHEVWIERDGAGPARIYLGEPGEPLPPGGDPEFGHLKAPRLLGAASVPQVRKAGYIEVAVPPGDVRAWDDAVFAPWGPEDKREGVTYYARAGRAETRTLMPFEIAPRTADGTTFVVRRDGVAAANLDVTVIGPDKRSSTLRTDAAGAVHVVTGTPGRYLLVATAKEEGGRSGDTPLAVHHRITTTSFVAR